jgi:hypothetical protein
MVCIFCDRENIAKSVEHIVSESLGNKEYIVARGTVCDDCNNKFAKFEGVALSNSILAMERARLGIATKKGKAAKGKIGEISVEGAKDFSKNIITVTGTSENNFTVLDHQTGRGNLRIQAFDKSEVASSKLLLKIALSSLFKSKKDIFQKYDFQQLKDFVTAKSIVDWPFLTTESELSKFQSIPRFYSKYLLGKLGCSLKYSEVDEHTLLFKFQYGAIPMVINLLNRNLTWIPPYIAVDQLAIVYPERYRKKLGITPP